MLYSSVIFQGQEGCLVASFEALWFQWGDNNSEEWLWSNLDKIVLSSARSAKCLMKIKQLNSDKKPLVFQFERRETAEAAKKDFVLHILQARRGEGKQDVSNGGENYEGDEADALLETSPILPTSIRSSTNEYSQPEILLEGSPSTNTKKRGNGYFRNRPKLPPGKPITSLKEFNSMLSMASRREKEEFAALLAQVSKTKQLEESEVTASLSYSRMEDPSPTVISNNEARGATRVESIRDSQNIEEGNSPFGDLDPVQRPTQGGRFRLFRGAKRSITGKRFVNRSIYAADKEGDYITPYGETTYTLLYLSGCNSQSFWYALFIYAIQLAAITLTLADISGSGVSNNKLGLPPMVEWTVTCAQALALFMALAYQSDLIQASFKLVYGFYPEGLQEHPGASCSKWVFACMAQMVSGMLLLTDCFILTMQARRVIEVMLNLTALFFMAEIDDVGFWMAKAGFISNKLQNEALSVVDFKVSKRRGRKHYRRIFYFLCLVGLLTGYGILKHRQLEGQYVQTFVYIQFGGAYNPKIPYYSGIFSSNTSENSRTHRRQYRDVATGDILLSYCDPEKVWTFSDTNDACQYFAKSTKTTTYDVASLPDSGWRVKDQLSRLHPFDSFSLIGHNCKPESCQGECIESLCVCPEDKFGIDCEFSNICPAISVDGRTKAFPSVPIFDHLSLSLNDQFIFDWELQSLSIEFELLKNSETGDYVRVYNMPVYYSSRTYPANVIFFGGRRWVFTSERGLFNMTMAREKDPSRKFFPEMTVATLMNNFHAYRHANYTPLLLSDPVDFKTPDFLPTPVGLGWWTVGVVNATARHYSPDSPLDTVLSCKSCLPEHGGYCVTRGGICNQTTGLCNCFPGHSGSRCEVSEACYDMYDPCYQHGACDEVTGSCRCEPPWHGNLCDRKYNCFEEQGRCENGGVCNADSGSCECPPGTGGVRCEAIMDCNIYGCANGGLCGWPGVCACRPPFHGVLCDQVDFSKDEFFCEEDEDCMNGTCNANSGTCSCEDPSSFGTLCQYQFDCTSSHLYKCSNFGECNLSTGLCDCKEPYFGPDCSKSPPCLNDYLDCSDWAPCDEQSGTCNCDLYAEFPGGLGTRCEVIAEKWDYNCPRDCFGWGICNDGRCECGPDHGGKYCNFIYPDRDNPDHWESFLSDIEECGFPPYPPNSSLPDNCYYLSSQILYR